MNDVSDENQSFATIGPAEVMRLRGLVYRNGLVTREAASRLFALNAAAVTVCPEWRDLFIEAITDFVVHEEELSGYVCEDKAWWLIEAVTRDGVAGTPLEVDLVVTVLEKARSAPDSLVRFALAQVADAVIEGVGPLAGRTGRLPNVVDGEDVELLRRILHASGGDGSLAITRSEAEVLLLINDRTVEEMNDPAWNELFVKSMTSYAMGMAGHCAPSRREALRRDAFFDDAAMHLGRFMSRMVTGGSGHASNDVDGLDAAWAERNRLSEAEARTAAIDPEEAEWLAGRLGNGRLLHDNERAFLSVIRHVSDDIPPALQPLVDKAG
jgi:hypothetical protein